MFEQDLVLCHMSNIIKEEIGKLKLRVLDWVPKSSDLNLVEMLWSNLDKKLGTKLIYSIVALTDRLQEEWNNLDKDLCIKLVKSMPERICKCLKDVFFHFYCIFLFCFLNNKDEI